MEMKIGIVYILHDAYTYLGLPGLATMRDAQALEVQNFKGIHVKCLLGQSHGKIGR